jgi:hypothetical protein
MAAAPVPSVAPLTKGSLSEESAIVSRARATLATNPVATLERVEEHARRFPSGELASEREFLRVSALRRLGRTAEARAMAQRYLTTYAESPYATSVRRILVELGEK